MGRRHPDAAVDRDTGPACSRRMGACRRGLRRRRAHARRCRVECGWGPAATISVARPLEQAPAQYEHRVIAGGSHREFRIVATQRSNSMTLATRRFRVVSVWPDGDVGPPMAVTGPQRVYAKPGWGGPTGPQNINNSPAKEEWRVGVAMFRVKGTSSNVNAGQRVTALKSDVSGPGRRRRLYEEVSFQSTPASTNPAHPKGTTITLLGDQVFGPIDLHYSWGNLFEHPDPSKQWVALGAKGRHMGHSGRGVLQVSTGRRPRELGDGAGGFSHPHGVARDRQSVSGRRQHMAGAMDLGVCGAFASAYERRARLHPAPFGDHARGSPGEPPIAVVA